jgi:copper resistance protein B
MLLRMIRILIICLFFLCTPLFASEPPEGSVFVELLEYRFANDVALLDAEAEYGTQKNRVALKFVGLSSREETETAAALLYRRAISETFDLQAGVEFAGDVNNLVIGFQAQAPHHVDTEFVTLLDEHGNGYLIGKIEHDFALSEKLVLWPRFEVLAAFQDDEANATGSGLSIALTDLRLRYEMHPSFMPYLGVSWELALGDSARMLEAAGEDKSVVTVVAGASFLF